MTINKFFQFTVFNYLYARHRNANEPFHWKIKFEMALACGVYGVLF